MAKGDFVWCDLSTFRVEDTKAFYTRLFGWTYDRLTQPDGSLYEMASTPAGEAAGLFEMPEKFQKIGLPSFWMPYIAVDSAEAACDRARRAGGKVEVSPLAWSEQDQIALIRDPLGAGFTVYEGTSLGSQRNLAGPGRRVGCALYVSDAGAVRGFYEALFDWRIAPEPDSYGAFRVSTADGLSVADIYELSDDIRGRYQFWGIHFGVSDTAAAKADIEGSGGEILYDYESEAGPATLAKDPDGAAFFVRAAQGVAGSPSTGAAGRTGFKWKTILGLALIYAAIAFEQNWLWGVLLLLWTMPAINRKEAFFLEQISRRANPVLYWLLIGTWLALSLYLILADFLVPRG